MQHRDICRTFCDLANIFVDLVIDMMISDMTHGRDNVSWSDSITGERHSVNVLHNDDCTRLTIGCSALHNR